MVPQRLEQLQQGIDALGGGLARVARAQQAAELFRRQAQFVVLDAEEVADALEVVGGRPALAAEVLVELGAVDRQLAADLRDRAVMAAKKLEIFPEMLGHADVLPDASGAIIASTRINLVQPAKLRAARPCSNMRNLPGRAGFSTLPATLNTQQQQTGPGESPCSISSTTSSGANC
ncbi:hypothetical protein FQZ97_874790 [compost metagenome]